MVLQPRFAQHVREWFACADPAVGQHPKPANIDTRDFAVERVAHPLERNTEDVADEPGRFFARVVRAMAVEETGTRKAAFELAPPFAHGRRMW